MPARKGVDWFLAGLVVAVGLAFVYPDGGARGGWMQPELVNQAGVALIFFLHGASLSFAALKAGTLRWPLHLVVQAGTFLLFPLLGLVLWRLLRDRLAPDLLLGVFFLCALPSTVSSSIALTAAARGNVAAAVFNATASNLIGVIATPLWLGLVVETAGASLPLGRVILDLLLWLVAPLVLGQLCRPLLHAVLARHKAKVQVVDRVTILLLVYTSFCDSFARGIWSGNGLAAAGGTLLLGLALLLLVMGLVHLACVALAFPVEDRITAVFCASKKTLAAGVPMAQVIFRGHPGLGLILLPIIIYHPLQLVVCAWLAGRWARRPA